MQVKSIAECSKREHSAILLTFIKLPFVVMEHSGSVVECWTRDRGAAGLSLTRVTALWSLSKTHPSLVLIQPRKTRPCLTDRLLIGPSLSYHLLLRTLFNLFLSVSFRQVLTVPEKGNELSTVDKIRDDILSNDGFRETSIK